MTVTHLTVELFDRHANRISIKTLPVEEALASVQQFVLLHGTDPDEDGKDADRGSINFWPATQREIDRGSTDGS